MKFNEQTTVENHIIQFLEKKLGFEFIKPADFEKLRAYEHEYISLPLFREAVRKINPGISDDEMRAVEQKFLGTESNKEFLQLMRNGVNVDVTDGDLRRTNNYKILDFDNVANNHFMVTNQMYFAGNAENIIPDVLVFVNGIPVVDIEAKSPTASDQVDYTKGIGQIKRYEKNAKNLFIPNCFNIATDGLKTVYGATYGPEAYFLEWKDADLEQEYSGRLEATLVALLEPKNLLDVIANFIVFEKTENGEVKKVARYQQLRATNKILDRVVSGTEKRGLVWHTQGSGKSLTMFFSAWKLRFEKKLENPKIFVLVDRVDLDDQIYETFINCGGQNVERVTSREELLRVINSPLAGIFISTIHKFDENVKDIKNEASNIIVLIDEAHRTQYGDLGMYLRNALPNASMIGFTGTPVAKTHEEFGLLTSGNPERYLDYYSIKQAIDDHATVPVVYEARLSNYAIDEKEIDAQFDLMTTGLSQEEKDLLGQKFGGRKSALVKLDKRMRAVARDMYEHYMAYVAPAGFKAQVVCSDREAVAKYKQIFDEIMPREWSEVIYSVAEPNEPDNEALKTYNKTKSEIKTIVQRFKDKHDPLRFLIVCDMLLTGFDAPIEQVMYLDKSLRDHTLLQAIARTNRTYHGKENGLIIDYYGITRNLKEALDFDESEVADALVNLDQVKKDFEKTFKLVDAFFLSINIEDPSIHNLRACLKLFEHDVEKQESFKKAWNHLKVLYEVISPDPYLAPFARKVEWFACFYVAFRKEFEKSDLDARGLVNEYGAKLKALIQDKVDYEGITKNYTPVRLDEMVAMNKSTYDESEEEKAKALERGLSYEISINLDTSPVFKTFSQRLKQIKEEFEKHQLTLQETLKQFYELRDDIKKVQNEAVDLGLNLSQFALYALAKEEGYLQDQETGALKEYVVELDRYLKDLLPYGWQDDMRREDFLKDIKRNVQMMLLQEYKDRLIIIDFSKYLNRLVDVVLKKY